MNDFIFVGNWFDQKYRVHSGGRYPTFKLALNLLGDRKNIVETGTTRLENDWGAGMSTLLFGDYCSHYGGHVWTVDILENAMQKCRIVTEEFKGVIDYVVSDSLKFLTEFDKSIDLLYLDSMDYPLDGSDTTPCQEHQLKEFKLAERLLNKFSIVLLDDNDFPHGGKTRLTKGYLMEKGWKCLLDLQQSLWVR